MNIQPNPGIASLAGTARAQAKGTDSDRRSPTADVASDLKLNAISGIEAGAKAEDRDADGRQLLDRGDGHDPAHCSDDRSDPQSHDDDGTAGPFRPATDGSGTHIDFDA